jgi:hypothetical protein
MPQQWFGDNTLPVAYQALPKEWATMPGLEIFIAPIFKPKRCVEVIQHIFGATIDGVRVPNPENPDGYVVTANIRGESPPEVVRSLAIWEGVRQLQEQFNRRLANISSMVEPVQAKFHEFFGNFVRDGLLVSTIGISPAGSGCYSSLAVILIQQGRKMAFTGREDPALTKQQTAICGLLASLGWEHPREKDPDPVFWAPRTIIYPMEIADLIDKIRTRHSNLIPDDLARVCENIAVLISAW